MVIKYAEQKVNI